MIEFSFSMSEALDGFSCLTTHTLTHTPTARTGSLHQESQEQTASCRRVAFLAPETGRKNMLLKEEMSTLPRARDIPQL